MAPARYSAAARSASTFPSSHARGCHHRPPYRCRPLRSGRSRPLCAYSLRVLPADPGGADRGSKQRCHREPQRCTLTSTALALRLRLERTTSEVSCRWSPGGDGRSWLPHELHPATHLRHCHDCSLPSVLVSTRAEARSPRRPPFHVKQSSGLDTLSSVPPSPRTDVALRGMPDGVVCSRYRDPHRRRLSRGSAHDLQPPGVTVQVGHAHYPLEATRGILSC